MNTPPPTSTKSTKSTSEIKVSFRMDRQLYDEIQSTLDEISSQLDLEVTMPKFLKRTVQDGWMVQAERFRKLESKLKQHKPGASEDSRTNPEESANGTRTPNTNINTG